MPSIHIPQTNGALTDARPRPQNPYPPSPYATATQTTPSNEIQSRPGSSHSNSNPTVAPNHLPASGLPSSAISKGADRLLMLIDIETKKATEEIHRQLADLEVRYEQLRVASATAWDNSACKLLQADADIRRLQAELAQGNASLSAAEGNALLARSDAEKARRDASQAAGDVERSKAELARLQNALCDIGITVSADIGADGSDKLKFTIGKEFLEYLPSAESKHDAHDSVIPLSSSSPNEQAVPSSNPSGSKVELDLHLVAQSLAREKMLTAVEGEHNATQPKHDNLQDKYHKLENEKEVLLEEPRKSQMQVDELEGLRQTEENNLNDLMGQLRVAKEKATKSRESADDAFKLLELSNVRAEKLQKERVALEEERDTVKRLKAAAEEALESMKKSRDEQVRELQQQVTSLREREEESGKLREATEGTLSSQAATVEELRKRVASLQEGEALSMRAKEDAEESLKARDASMVDLQRHLKSLQEELAQAKALKENAESTIKTQETDLANLRELVAAQVAREGEAPNPDTGNPHLQDEDIHQPRPSSFRPKAVTAESLSAKSAPGPMTAPQVPSKNPSKGKNKADTCPSDASVLSSLAPSPMDVDDASNSSDIEILSGPSMSELKSKPAAEPPRRKFVQLARRGWPQSPLTKYSGRDSAAKVPSSLVDKPSKGLGKSYDPIARSTGNLKRPNDAPANPSSKTSKRRRIGTSATNPAPVDPVSPPATQSPSTSPSPQDSSPATASGSRPFLVPRPPSTSNPLGAALSTAADHSPTSRSVPKTKPTVPPTPSAGTTTSPKATTDTTTGVTPPTSTTKSGPILQDSAARRTGRDRHRVDPEVKKGLPQPLTANATPQSKSKSQVDSASTGRTPKSASGIKAAKATPHLDFTASGSIQKAVTFKNFVSEKPRNKDARPAKADTTPTAAASNSSTPGSGKNGMFHHTRSHGGLP
ncbi:hypothetical protein BV22DRAFT_381309 [Leucogyrophana mollusca]|uniref:Uncharacterized protein n=1 Tax=Leucogyrophana mollusca TaxID=85980 RepID=A0ACB8BL19_9AGAM|nr:hypothetical protein BV22DRAFT_381309 [Leucogyrophana mollusca]